jgi:restriction system-associated AAA family ATPase
MKLISVKILGDDFRSLAANKLYKFNYSFRNDRLSTKVFAGLNGSGKSNFLELFSEIFYYLEIYHLPTVSKGEKKNKNFGFEIEYFLPMIEADREMLYGEPIEDSFLQVRIIKNLDEEPQFSIKKETEENYSKRVDKFTQLLLPTKVIAYTSGQNELLSNPYYKLKYHYFKEFSKQEAPREIELSENHRLFFLDYSTNFSIFVANMLLGDERKLNYLKKVLNVNNLQAFRITINMVDVYKKAIPISDALLQNINRLKLCTTTWIEKKIGKEHLLVLDYLVTSATKDAFEFHFTNAFNLFKVFYELEIMNLFLVGKDARNLMLRVHKTYNFSDELPKPDPSRLVFRIEKIWINKSVDEKENKTKNIYYKALSDGEHQFNEVIGTILMMEQEGCLFLIDEPDTHFNPKWRSKLINMFNYMAAISFDDKGNIERVRKQEIIITTHSPFVISDSTSEDVYRFVKENQIVEFDNPKIQMYGASISIILDEIFEKEETISDMARQELKDMLDNVTTLEELRKIVDRLNTEFGDSVEKFDLFSKLKGIKEQIEKKSKD